MVVTYIRSKLRILFDSIYCKQIGGKVELGSDCSWFIDASYLSSDSVVYSAGVGNDVSFEEDLCKEFGCNVFLFDPSETGIKTMKNLVKNEKLLFFPVGLAQFDGISLFALPKIQEEGSYTYLQSNENVETCQFPVRAVSSLAKQFNHSSLDLLKLDIEGFEYEVLHDVLNSEIEIKQICVEFHHFFEGIPKAKTRELINLMKSHGYRIIHKRRLDYTFIKHNQHST